MYGDPLFYMRSMAIQRRAVLSGKGYLSTDAMLTYPIDAATKFMFGTGVITDSIHYRNYERDWIAATQVRLGRMRIYASGRSWGPVTKSSVDFRIFYMF
jgi:hypothetical protein